MNLHWIWGEEVLSWLGNQPHIQLAQVEQIFWLRKYLKTKPTLTEFSLTFSLFLITNQKARNNYPKLKVEL